MKRSPKRVRFIRPLLYFSLWRSWSISDFEKRTRSPNPAEGYEDAARQSVKKSAPARGEQAQRRQHIGLEGEPSAHLNNPHAGGRGDFSVERRSQVGRWVVQAHQVKGVGRFAAKLEGDPSPK